MITERAQLQLAKEMGVRVDDTMLDRAIGRIAENQKMSVQDMRNAMEKEGMPFAQFREQIRNEIMMQRLIEHEVDSKIQVTDAEIDTYLAAEKAAAADRVEMDIAQILVRMPENAVARADRRAQGACRRSRAPAAHRRRLRQDGRHLFRLAGRAARAAKSAGATRTACRRSSPTRCAS